MSNKQTFIGALYLSFAAAIWGGMYVISKAVLQWIPPWILLEMRFILGLATLLLFVWIKREGRVDLRDIPLFALIGFIGYTCSIGMQFVGTDLSSAALGSLITASSPAMISIFAWLILKEKLNRLKAFSLLVSTAGVALVIGWPQHMLDSNKGYIGNWILLGAAVTWALYTVLSRLQTKKYSSLTVTMWASLFGAIFTAPISIWQHIDLNPVYPTNLWIWLGVVYLGVVSTAVAFYLWNKGFEHVDASTGSLFFFVQPLVGSVLGWIFLGESVTLNWFIGALFILIGIYLSSKQVENQTSKINDSVKKFSIFK